MHRFALPSLLAVAALALTPPLSSQGYLLRRWIGTAPGDSFSHAAVSTAGDIDGDGFGDVIVGSDQITGGGNGYVKVLSGFDGSLLFFFTPPAGVSFFGLSVNISPSLDGDDIQDILVGCAGNSEGFIFSGADGSLIHSFASGAPHAQGFMIAGGDLNNDQIPDVVIGKPCGSGGPTNIVRMYSGADWSLLKELSSGGCFGRVAAVEDINGDQLDDILVGERFYASGTGEIGRVQVYSGDSGSTVYADILGPIMPNPRFGGSVSVPGDIDGDQTPDFLVGAPTSDPNMLLSAGQAFLYSGIDGSLIHTFDGSAAGDNLGATAKGSADLDGDDVPDLVIGSPQAQPAPGFVQIFSGASKDLICTIPASSADGEFGVSLAIVDDTNNDGFDDILIGDYLDDPLGMTDAGSASLFSIVGLPLNSETYGEGCTGTASEVPSIKTSGGSPFLGNADFNVALGKAPPSTPVVLILGSSSQNWAGFPLPLDLGFLGLGGCSLLTAVDRTFSHTSTSTGIVFAPVPIPSDPSLSGRTFYFQWLTLEGSMSRGLRLTLE